MHERKVVAARLPGAALADARAGVRAEVRADARCASRRLNGNMRQPLFPAVLALLSTVLALLVLTGWALDIDLLKHGMASSVAMNPTTAFCLVLLGLEAVRINTAGNHAAWSGAGQLALIVVIAASLMKLCDLMFGTSLAIEQYLFSAKLGLESIYPSRMAPHTTACLLLLGLALQFMRGSADTAALKAQALGAVALLVALLALVGNLFEASELSGIAHYIPMAVNTALCICLLSIGILSAEPNSGLMRLVRWHSLKTGLIFFTMGIFVIGTWSLAFYASRTLREDMQRLLGEQQFSTVSLIAAQVSDELGDRLGGLEKVAASMPPAVMGSTAAAQAFLEQQSILRSLFNGGIVAYRLDGTAIAEVPLSAGRIGTNYMDLDTVAAALRQGKLSIAEPVLGKKLRKPVIGMTVPVRDAQGKVIGALSGVTNLGIPNFLDKITESSYGKSGGYVLADKQHRLFITATDKKYIMAPFPSPGANPLFDRYLQGFEGSGLVVDTRGIEVLSSAKQIPIAGWLVIARTPTEEAFAPIRAMQQRMLLAAILLTVLAGGLTWWMLRRYLAPLVDTAKTLAAITDTNQIPQLLRVGTQNEIGDLIGGFNRLLKTLGQREQALRASEARSQAITRSARAAILTTDESGNIAGWNPAATAMFGYTESEVMGQAVTLLMPERYRDGHLAGMNRIRSGAEVRGIGGSVELRGLRKDGSEFPLDMSLAKWEADGGWFVTGILRDITEREQAQAALRQSETRNRKLMDASPDGIWIHNEGRINYVNDALVSMLGYSNAEQLLDHSIYEFFPPEELVALRARVKATATNRAPVTALTTRLRRDGSPIPVEVTAAGYVQDGTPWSIAICRDVTERSLAEAARAKLEAQLRESQKMEALGTLAGGVAHDFNNALAAILGNVELVRQDVGPGHLALESLEEISKAGRRAKDLVQQILAFGRRQTLDRKATSLALVVVETARLMRASLPAGVSLKVECGADAPAVLADATQIQQILLNLYSNAVHAVKDQARPTAIEVRLDAHTQGEARGDLRPGRYTCLTVRDNGPGMDEATRARIFEPFFTTKPVGQGTGLGLSVIHGIVKAHQASIEVDSAPGAGSAFRIYFPAVETPLPEVPVCAANTTPVHGKGKHVLYVDDEEAIIFLMKRLLERKGFRVSGYTDPQQALAAVRANPGQFDLAVTDYNMPGMTGLEVALELKQIRGDMPVVMASGYITEELRAKAPAAGVRELIYKPNTVDDLCEAVARFADAQSGGGRPS